MGGVAEKLSPLTRPFRFLDITGLISARVPGANRDLPR